MVPARTSAPAVTELLRAVEAGNARARDELDTAVYGEMLSVIQRTMSKGPASRKVSPTALVHGTALKLMVQQKLSARDRAHFVAYSAKVVRQVLVDHALTHGGTAGMTLVATPAEEPKEEINFGALHAALGRLALLSAEQARLVELRYFGGLTIEEIAALDGTTAATVKKDWQSAHAWLNEALAA